MVVVGWLQIPLAFVLDLVLGDPRWLPHPVVLMGKAISRLERNLIGRETCGAKRNPWEERLKGALLVVVLVAGTYLLALALIRIAAAIVPLASGLLSVLFLYTAVSARSLAEAAMKVKGYLDSGDIAAARLGAGEIVGRDTGELNEEELVRATVESVAENTVDGVFSPLFYGLLGGGPLALAFKAVSTLDSMVGHKDERYLYFGWASAKLDDLANWLPARISGLLIPAAAFLCGLDARSSWRIMLRDRRGHPSPNCGIPESAMAGALGVRLGGLNYYDGLPELRPYMGDPKRPLHRDVIPEAVRLMWASSILFVVLGSLFTLAVELVGQ